MSYVAVNGLHPVPAGGQTGDARGVPVYSGNEYTESLFGAVR